MSHGPGGNTSIKINDSIYIKSSGTWLKDSLKKKSFIKINLNSIKKNIENEKKWIYRKSASYPSIETTMHAVINKKYVVHLHSISVLSYAILKNGKKLLESKLKDMKWIWIKYKKPGLNLAKEIKRKMFDDTNIYNFIKYSNKNQLTLKKNRSKIKKENIF